MSISIIGCSIGYGSISFLGFFLQLATLHKICAAFSTTFLSWRDGVNDSLLCFLPFSHVKTQLPFLEKLPFCFCDISKNVCWFLLCLNNILNFEATHHLIWYQCQKKWQLFEPKQ
jgi:hypothetical protein